MGSTSATAPAATAPAATFEGDKLAEALETALGWSAKQAHILTGGGRAEGLYSAARGYPHAEDELPHYHLQRDSSRLVFAAWALEARAGVATSPTAATVATSPTAATVATSPTAATVAAALELAAAAAAPAAAADQKREPPPPPPPPVPLTPPPPQRMCPPPWLAGAWSRPIFAGGGLISTDADEACFNLVTLGGPFVAIPSASDCS